MDRNRHERTQIIRTYECDGNLRLRPESILRWIQDIAEEHASLLGFGYDMCMKSGTAWVELRLYIKIHRNPVWKEAVHVTTWSYPLSPVIAARDFIMKDESGNTIIEAATQWALIDMNRRRPTALRKHLDYFNDRPASISSLQQQMTDIPDIESTRSIDSFHVKYHTVDFNRHVNNSAYLVWALDCLDEGMQEHPPSEIRIDFKKESMPGDIIDIYEDKNRTHRIFSLAGKHHECARVQLTWDIKPD